MICPECKSEGKTSKVFVGLTSKTLVGFPSFYDEKGVFHSHDPNTITTDYRCSNGHTWVESSKNACPNCSYGS